MDVKADPVDREGAVGTFRQGDAQPIDAHNEIALGTLKAAGMDDGVFSGSVVHGYLPFRLSRGFSASFSPSPTRFNVSTVRSMARSGKKLTHQA